MHLDSDIIIKALNEGKLLLYEDELIKRLRDISFQGFPLSISVLSKIINNGSCYVTSVNLTRGMDYFYLVHGDVNFLDKNYDYPNHSWVEKDGFVYDPSDGFKWEKNLYYELFKPDVKCIYNEVTVKDYEFYQSVLNKKEEVLMMEYIAIILQYLEVIELENPSINQDLLLKEINLFRENNNISIRYSDEAIKEYRKILESI